MFLWCTSKCPFKCLCNNPHSSITRLASVSCIAVNTGAQTTLVLLATPRPSLETFWLLKLLHLPFHVDSGQEEGLGGVVGDTCLLAEDLLFTVQLLPSSVVSHFGQVLPSSRSVLFHLQSGDLLLPVHRVLPR